MATTVHFVAIAFIACSMSINSVKSEAIQMTLSCDKDSGIETVQPACKVSEDRIKELVNITQGLKNKIQEMETSFKKMNQAGTFYCNPGKSCQQIKMANPQADDGEYWVEIDQPRKVYCDMTTDGGGWMLVSNIVSETTQGQAWSLANDFKKISEYSSNSLGLSTSALASLQNHIHFDQLRFFCHKKARGRTVNIATKNNTAGKTVARYFTGRTDSFPTACGSYDKMADDNSFLSQQCSQWGYDGGVYKVNKWSHDSIPKQTRLFNHVAFVKGNYHWLLSFAKGGRWECDDTQGALSVGDIWQIYVR